MTKNLTHRPQVGGGEHGVMETAASVYDENGTPVASIRPSSTPAEANELAKLFAFAPRLLAELRRAAERHRKSRVGRPTMPNCPCPGCAAVRLIAEYDGDKPPEET